MASTTLCPPRVPLAYSSHRTAPPLTTPPLLCIFHRSLRRYYQLLGSSCFGVPIEQHLKSAGKGTLRQTLTANRSLYLSSRGFSALGTAGGLGFGSLHE